MLRERLLGDLSNKGSRNKGSRVSSWVILAYIIKAWNFYRKGESINRLRFTPGGAMGESFPEAE